MDSQMNSKEMSSHNNKGEEVKKRNDFHLSSDEIICNILIPLENYKDKVNPQAFTSLTLRQNETRQNYLVWPRQLNFKTSGCI